MNMKKTNMILPSSPPPHNISHNDNDDVITSRPYLTNDNIHPTCCTALQSPIDVFLGVVAVQCVVNIINMDNYKRVKMLANQTNTSIIVVPHYLMAPPIIYKSHTQHNIQKTSNMIVKQREKTKIKKYHILVKNAAMARLLPSILANSNCETLMDLLSLWTMRYNQQNNHYEYTNFGEQFFKQNDTIDDRTTIITPKNLDISLEVPYILNTIYNAYNTLNIKYNIHRDEELIPHKMINYIMNQNHAYREDLSMILCHLIRSQHDKFAPNMSYNIKQHQDINNMSPIIQSTIKIFTCIHRYNSRYKSFAVDSFEMKFLKSAV